MMTIIMVNSLVFSQPQQRSLWHQTLFRLLLLWVFPTDWIVHCGAMPACTPGLHVTGPALFVFVSSISSVHPHPTHLSASILRPSNSFTLNKHISSRFVFICKQCSIRIWSALSRMWHECLVCTCASVVARPGETPGAGRIWCVDNDSVYHFLILISLRLGVTNAKIERPNQSNPLTETYIA